MEAFLTHTWAYAHYQYNAHISRICEISAKLANNWDIIGYIGIDLGYPFSSIVGRGYCEADLSRQP